VPGADDKRGMIHDNALIPGDSVIRSVHREENHETKVLPFLVSKISFARISYPSDGQCGLVSVLSPPWYSAVA